MERKVSVNMIFLYAQTNLYFDTEHRSTFAVAYRFPSMMCCHRRMFQPPDVL